MEELDLNEIRKELARRSLLDFTKYTFPAYEVNWHHKLVCEYLDRWAFGDIDRLMLFMPPQNGKSELVSRRLPAYIFGRNPDAKIIATSYGADLASSMNRDVQRIIDSDYYKELFPSTQLSGKNVVTVAHGQYLRNSEIFEIVDHKGVYKCAGTGGPITGRGFEYGIIDDPIKSRQEAESVTYRNGVWSWYTSDFYTRCGKNAKILLTVTRWNMDDLPGRLIRQMNEVEGSDQWGIVTLPAIAEEPIADYDIREPGDALWPNKYPLEFLDKVKIQSSYDWVSMYQQHPVDAKGMRVKREWLKYEDSYPKDLKVVMGVDLAISEKASADYTAVAVLGRDESGNVHVLDVQRIRASFSDQINFIKSMSSKWNPSIVAVEDVAYQRAMVQTLSQQTTLNVLAVHPDRDKVSRFAPLEARYEQGQIIHLRGLPQAFESELLSFPVAEHDDMVDAMSTAWVGYGQSYQVSEWMPDPEQVVVSGSNYNEGLY